MGNDRRISQIFKGKLTLEGAGVRLKRALGYYEVPLFDPFLLLDDFHSDNPDDYRAGFPWHPHRGIETVTYLLHGSIRHEDSMGNGGIISPGELQWMTAGSGIVHSEMPEPESGLLWGFQLWVNLPARYKMMPPRYRGVTRQEVPVVALEDGGELRVIAGVYEKTKGPVRDIVVEPQYLDVRLTAGSEFEHRFKIGSKVFAYVVDGEGVFDDGGEAVKAESAVLYGDGGPVRISAGKKGVRFLLISGMPIREPIAWGGPIVMNTEIEVDKAFREYNEGTFIKTKKNK